MSVAILLFSFAFASGGQDHPPRSWQLIPFGVFVVLKLFSQWREFRQARQRLDSWNAVTQDYGQITKETHLPDAGVSAP